MGANGSVDFAEIIFRPHDKAIEFIKRRPEIIWKDEDAGGACLANWIVRYRRHKVLEFMLDFISSLEVSNNEKKRLLKAAFEKKDKKGRTLAHAAAEVNNIYAFDFIARHFPGLFEIQDDRGRLPIDITVEAGYRYVPILSRLANFDKYKELLPLLKVELIEFEEPLDVGPFVSMIFELINQEIEVKCMK